MLIRQSVVVVVLLLLGGPLPQAQTTPEALLNLGRYEELETMLSGATDARSIALRARAMADLGRYAEAEKLLAGPAARQPGSDAALELGLLQVYLGRTAEGRRTLDRIFDNSAPRTAADYLRLGRAARALGEFKDAEGFLRNADRLAPNDAVINNAWGEMLLEKYNLQEALTSFQTALKANENLVAAQVGIARLAAEGNPPTAKAALDKALQLNPRYVPALLLQAEMALDSQEREAASSLLQKALEVNPNRLEAHAMVAAVAFLQGREADFEGAARKALAINPVYADAYRVAGSQAGRNYRFDEAVVLTRRALALDSNNTAALTDLGSHLLRTGDERGARAALEQAFKQDPYDIVKINALRLLDHLDKFVTITEGDLIIRLDPDEAPVMREQLIPLAKEALATLSKRYQFTPRGPILVEMFPIHDDFAVRTIGLPGFVGALGACFGRVVTLDSPRARPPGEFSWQETLWHEMAHVITLQMSNNRIPRWLSEGASVYEERRGRPEWGRESDLPYVQALNENKLLKLENITSGFSDPELIGLTYYQSSHVVEHLIETYGEPSFWAMLRAFGRGLDTNAALKEIYGISIADLQTAFDARMEKQYAGLRAALKRPEFKGPPTLEDLKAAATANPNSFMVQMMLGAELRKAKDPAGAIAAFERALGIIPQANGPLNPNAQIAAVAVEQKDSARAIRALEALVRVDPSDVEAARQLATLLEPSRDAARIADAFTRVAAIDPFDSRAQSAVGRFALQRKDGRAAVMALRSALATKPPDRAAAHADLAEAYLLLGQTADARRETLAALEIAPSFERAQDLLLQIVK